MKLFHYTCDHSAAKIRADGLVLKPNPRSYGGLLWLTDLAVPDVRGLGLTSFMLRCNRTEWRAVVDTELAEPWTRWAHEHVVPHPIRMVLDGADGAMPRHWWVTEGPVQAERLGRTRSWVPTT